MVFKSPSSTWWTLFKQTLLFQPSLSGFGKALGRDYLFTGCGLNAYIPNE